MKELLKRVLCCGLLVLAAGLGSAQEADPGGELRLQIQRLQENFDQQQRELRERFERMLREQQAEIDSLKRQLSALPTNPAPALTATNPPPETNDVEELRQRVDELTKASKRTLISQFNPGIGFAVDSIFSYTSKGEPATGFERPGGFDAFLRTAELNLEAAVDPFARAYGVISGSADAQTGEASLEVEEASIVTTSLPWRLTVQGGRFFADFGRFSYIHAHDLPFVFRPLVLERYIGGESRTDGAQVNYLFPTEQYISLTLGVGNGFGGDLGAPGVNGYRSIGELNAWGHASTYFDLSESMSLELGASGLVDASAEGIGDDPQQRDRYIGAVDLTLRYQPLGSGLREGYVWGTELLFNSARFDLDEGRSSRENAAGLYSYLEKKVSRRFKIGFLFDWMQEPANADAETFRFSPYITWNPSEFQYLRLQYSHTEPNAASGYRSSDAIYLQWTAFVGRHVHGFKQR